MEKFCEGFSLLSGVVSYSDLGFLIATKDSLTEKEIPHTRILQYDRGQWGGWDLDWFARSITICGFPERRLLTMSDMGTVKVIGGGNESEELIKDTQHSPDQIGPLVEIHSLQLGKAYAVGTCRQVYRREGPNQWIRIDRDLWKIKENITEKCFHSIDGFSENEIYTVGWDGEIWLFNGELWEEIQSPTNLALYKILCAEDGYAYIVGQSGIILKGRLKEWEIIDQSQTSEDFWGLAWLNNKLFISSLNNIYELNGSVFGMVNTGDGKRPKTTYHLSAADGILWSIGKKDLFQFDGATWRELISI